MNRKIIQKTDSPMFTRKKSRVFKCWIIVCIVYLTTVSATAHALNPNDEPVALADPFIFYENGTYYAYGTGDNDGIPVFISKDLKHWRSPQKDGSIRLALHKQDSYGEKWFWAPEVYHINGKYYMYYSAEEHICVATADSPLGPFRQTQKQPMMPGRNIDNSLFIDQDGEAYLFWAKVDSCNSIWVCKLDKDLQTPLLESACPCIRMSQNWEKAWPSVNEGPFVIHHNNTYYLTYSANSYESPLYGLGYATAKHPLGPWVKAAENPILQTPGSLQGSGHHAIFKDKKGTYRVVFHAHYAPGKISPRIMHISKMKFIRHKNEADRLAISPRYITPILQKAQ